MYNATAKPKDKQHTVTGVGSPAPGPVTPKGAKGGVVSPPVLKNYQKPVPSLKPNDIPGQPVITSPEAQPPAASPGSPVKALSPRKIIRSMSEKLSAVSPRIEEALSPRTKATGILDDVAWLDNGTPMPTVSSPSPESPPNRKRKATDHQEPNDGSRKSADSDHPRSAKRVRFNIDPQSEPIEARIPHGEPGYMQRTDPSIQAPGKPAVPPPRPTTPAPPDLTPIKLLPALKFGTPTLRKGTSGNAVASSANNDQKVGLAMPLAALATAVPPKGTASSDVKPNVDVLLKTRLAEPAQRLQEASGSHETPDHFPFAPDRLGKWAIKQREKGNEWIGKASGRSLAATLQRTLDGLQTHNAGRIDTKACGYLQEMFGLLPAGTDETGKVFNYTLMKSFYSLGLNHAQWDAIERLSKDFDKLDTRHDPDGCAVFKAKLGEIVAAKNGLMYARQLTEKPASGSINS